MKMALEVLEKAITKHKAAKSDLARMKIADKWFERNAEITLEEMRTHLQRRYRR